ncbi:MAG: Protein sirB1 [uncultured Solirubrobacteraceae bacterium]|uniref:Protein sirB1 n=1 Tax=uncultured Solirubrobacteraceae bacterium TaxID=1162706 RepID=A0A6J4RSJ0_9ACTN|nr:MAG: Protein sirB1 [uncultured Solirubrobacteraceae bacterium]
MNGEPTAFSTLARDPATPLDALALALAGAFRPVDAGAAMDALDALGAEIAIVASRASGSPVAEAETCAAVLGGRHGYLGDRAQYDDPRNSMLDAVIERRRGLPIVLSVVYAEAARRAGIPLRGVGLPGHFVVGHFGAEPPFLIDPFNGGRPVGDDVPRARLRPWTAPEIALRMLNNLVPAFERRGDLGAAIRAASMRLELPSAPALRETLELELRTLRARLN